MISLGIRPRLLALTLGIAVPFGLVGLAALRGIWTTSRRQLENSLEQRAELAAVALERWIEAQREPLTTIAVYSIVQNSPALTEDLRFTSTRPHWIDLRIVDAKGSTQMVHAVSVEEFPPEVVSEMFAEMSRRRSWALVTDSGTRGAQRPILAIGSPIEIGGAVMARVDAEGGIKDLFHGVELADGAILAVFDLRGRALYRSGASQGLLHVEASSQSPWTKLNGRRTAIVEAISPYDGVRRVYGIARAGTSDLTVIIGITSDVLYAPASMQLTRYVLFSAVAVFCAVLAALFIARRIILPLRRLGSVAQRLGAGNLSARAPQTSYGEVAELGTTFNQMAAKIEEREVRLTELDRLKSEFVSNVSHELRTPLTTIKTLTHVMLRNGYSKPEQRAYLETIAIECDRQIELVLNLFDLSRIEADLFNVSPERVDVCEIARACVLSARLRAEERGHHLILDLPADLPSTTADYGVLRRVLGSLVDNAIRYTADGGRITIAAELRGDDVCISIADTGVGIERGEVPRIFDKFYRVRNAASPGSEVMNEGPSEQCETPGLGLGLYLARHMVEKMDGSIKVESGPELGSKFTVCLPVWRDEIEAEGLDDEEDRDVEATARRG